VAAVRHLNEIVLDGVTPDLVAVIDVDPAVGLSRQHDPDRIGGEGLAFQRRVAEAYHRLAMAEPERVRLFPADRTPEDIAGAILEALVAGAAR
jgi:dTMP kinase